MQPCRTPETISKKLCVPTCSLYTAAGVVIQCLEDINEPVRNAVVCQNFPQGWPVYTVKCLVKIDEVDDEVMFVLWALFNNGAHREYLFSA